METNLEERTIAVSPVAVVTGAYRGLGLETCRQLAERGYLVVRTARREAEGQAAAARLADRGLDVRWWRKAYAASSGRRPFPTMVLAAAFSAMGS